MKDSNSKKIKEFSLIFLILSTILLGIIPVINIDDDSEILINDDSTNEVFITPKLQNSLDPNLAEWWNKNWSYGVNINVTANGTLKKNPINFTNRLVEININFTVLLQQQAEYGEFIPDSIRIIEYNSSSKVVGEIPSQFDPATGYDQDTNAIGELSWVLNGTTNSSITRYFFIYFDVVENGVKPAPNYNLGLSLTENTPMVDYTLENDKLKVSMDNTQRGGYYSHIYEVKNKQSGIDQQRADYKWGWVLNSWTYGGVDFSISRIDVVSNGPIKKIVKMVQDTANFLYERFYTVNYLDDTVHIKHKITAKTTLAQGTWQFASWWYPGVGGTNKEAIDSAYGMGGDDFSDAPFWLSELGDEFTNAQHLTDKKYWNKKWRRASEAIKAESWFVHWNYLNYESVGTIWDNFDDNQTQFNKYGYHDGETYEGSSIYLEYKPPELAQSGDSFEFNVWGIIYNNTETGLYTKNRADGLQDRPLISPLGECQAAGKVLIIHAQDLDGALIEGAEAELYNSTGKIVNNLTTDSIGNVTFRGLINDTYTVSVYYRVNETRFWIKNETVIIDLPPDQRKVFRELDCNLTTVNMLASDSASGSSLFEAYLTIWNSTGGYIIRKATDVNGWISQKLPADLYNVSAFYQAQATELKLNISVLDFAFTQNFTLTNKTDINATLLVSNKATNLTIEKTIYIESGWNHEEEISDYPYYIRLYINDTVNITVHYHDIQNDQNIPNADKKNFTLYKGEDVINDSYSLDEIGSGNYSFKIFSHQYMSGIYSLKINLSKSATHQDAIIYIEFEIKNHTSQIQKIDAGSNLNVYWNDNVTLFINYTTVLPEFANIPQATVNYSIVGTSYKRNMTDLGGGNYSLKFNTSVLELGTYELFITANKTNIDLAMKMISFTVNEIPTSVFLSIDNDFEVTPTYFKIAKGEFTSIIANYSVDPTGDYTGSGSSVSALISNITSVDGDYPSTAEFIDLSDGRYNLTINASQFCTGDYRINLICYEEHHEDQIQAIILRVLDNWNTKVDLIVPPSLYPWSNNASFIINYYCITDPRTNRLLSGANINTLNISVKTGQSYQFFMELGPAELGNKWGYFDLESDPLYGAGYYLIWFNTSYVNVSESTVFYVSPTLSKMFYSTYTYNPYLWIRPVYTTLILKSDRSSVIPVKKLSFYLDQSSEITVIYNVSDPQSALNGQLINNATLTYEIRNDSLTYNLINMGSIKPIYGVNKAGQYKYNLKANLLGDFILIISAVKENYSLSIESIYFSVDKKLINYTFGSNVKETVFFTPQNRPVSITLNLTDVIHNTYLSGATILVTFEGNTYVFYDDPDNPGIYIITFNETMLAGVMADTTYPIEIKIIKTNYTTQEVILSIDIGLPVDPFLGIPYLYWMIIGTTIIISLGIYGTSKYVKYRRIPAIIKAINHMEKRILKGKKISEKIITETYNEQFLNQVNHLWKEIGLDLSEKMMISKEISKTSLESEKAADNYKDKGGLDK